MKNLPLPRLDKNPEIRERLLRYCRISKGEVWEDSCGGHRVGCLDSANPVDVDRLMRDDRGALAVQDPPYNQVAFERTDVDRFIDWCRRWITATYNALADNAALYVWMGA